MVNYTSNSSNNYSVISYLNGYSKSIYSPKKSGQGCTCFGQGCKGTCRF
ncbi:MAG: hypothetical protein AABW48_04730 [Nanoarchaeota archaeon]